VPQRHGALVNLPIALACHDVLFVPYVPIIPYGWNIWHNRNVGYSRNMQEEPMVGASDVIRTLDIPRVSFYRAVNEGRIPFREERKPWQKRAVKRFVLSEVRAALEMEPPAPAE
jgi:hypothetical protein